MMASVFKFENIYRAYLDCRRNKRNKRAALMFEVNAEENIFQLTRELAERTYRPSPSFCFVAKNDKHREVFAADFRDRIIHHFLVRYLEKEWEPVFIHDSYACRRGKGTHAAVRRLQSFSRKVTANQTRRAWFAQLDVRAFFPSIDRQILLELVESRIENEEIRWLAGVIILHDPTGNPVFTCSRRKWRNVPSHKSLFSVPFGKGLPIGNLTSQFLANVYLNKLDQFVKHSLKAQYYIRYVDDMLLLHTDKIILQEWRTKIDDFLKTELKLELHPTRQRVLPVSNGIDFLGYLVRHSHLLVRRKVVEKFKQTVARYTDKMVRRQGEKVQWIFSPKQTDRLHSIVQSYFGLFHHGACYHLAAAIFHRFPVLPLLYDRKNFRIKKRWVLPFRPKNLFTQFAFFRSRFRGRILLQVGCYLELFNTDAVWAGKILGLTRIPPRKGFYARCGIHVKRVESLARKLSGADLLFVLQTGQKAGSIAQRVATRMDVHKRGAEKDGSP